MYGVKTQPSLPVPVEEVVSSQGSVEAPSAVTAPATDQEVQPDTSCMRVDKAHLCMRWTTTAGEPRSVPLIKGPGTYCVAQVGERVVDTEVPNLMLEPPPTPVIKRPAAKKGNKKTMTQAEVEKA